jgi:glycerol-3-phosphate dehydrogenase
MIPIGIQAGLSEVDSKYIAEHYGTNSKLLFEIAHKGREEAVQYSLPVRVYTQLIYAIEYEATVSPSDFFIRRSGLLYFNPSQVEQWKEPVINLMRNKLQWSESIEKLFREDLEKQIKIAAMK